MTRRPARLGHRDEAASVASRAVRGLRPARNQPRWEWLLGPLVAIAVVAMAVIGLYRAAGPTVAIDCPDSVMVGDRLSCMIASDKAVAGHWELPGFLAEPLDLETLNADNEIFVEPTNPDVVGQEFTITATVESDNGRTASATHTFVVVAN